MDSSSDIYNVKEPAWANKPPARKQNRRRPRIKTFDEAVNKDLSGTHRRRSRNSGFRRLRHRMKDPKFSRRFWVSLVVPIILILLGLLVWDWFFRYPPPKDSPAQEINRPEAE